MFLAKASTDVSDDVGHRISLVAGAASSFHADNVPSGIVGYTWLFPVYFGPGFDVAGDNTWRDICGLTCQIDDYSGGANQQGEFIRITARSGTPGFTLWSANEGIIRLATVSWEDMLGSGAAASDMAGRRVLFAVRPTATNRLNFSIIYWDDDGVVQIQSALLSNTLTLIAPTVFYIGNQTAKTIATELGGMRTIQQLKQAASFGFYVHNDALTDDELKAMHETNDASAWFLGPPATYNPATPTLVYNSHRPYKSNSDTGLNHGVGGGSWSVDEFHTFDAEYASGSAASSLATFDGGRLGSSHVLKGAACIDANVDTVMPCDCGWTGYDVRYSGTRPDVTTIPVRSSALLAAASGGALSVTAIGLHTSNSRIFGGQDGQPGFKYRGDGLDPDLFNRTGLSVADDFNTRSVAEIRTGYTAGWAAFYGDNMIGFGGSPQESFNDQSPFYCRNYSGVQATAGAKTITGLNASTYDNAVDHDAAREYARCYPGHSAIFLPLGEKARFCHAPQLGMDPAHAQAVDLLLPKTALMRIARVRRGCMSGANTVNVVTASTDIDCQASSVSRVIDGYTASSATNAALHALTAGGDSVAQDLGLSSLATRGLFVEVEKALHAFPCFSVCDLDSTIGTGAGGEVEVIHLGRAPGGDDELKTNITPQAGDTVHFSIGDIVHHRETFPADKWGAFNASTGVVNNNWPMVEVEAVDGPVVILFRGAVSLGANGVYYIEAGDGGTDYGVWKSQYFADASFRSPVTNLSPVERCLQHLLGLGSKQFHLMHSAQNSGLSAGVLEVVNNTRAAKSSLKTLYLGDLPHEGSGNPFGVESDGEASYHEAVETLSDANGFGFVMAKPLSVMGQLANGVARDTAHYTTQGSVFVVRDLMAQAIVDEIAVLPDLVAVGGPRRRLGARAMPRRSL